MKLTRTLSLALLTGLALLAPACRGHAGGDGKALASIGEWINVEDVTPTLETLRGRPVVVEFWATWCPPCVKSVPHLVDLHEEHADDGLAILGIHAQRGASEREAIESFVERNAMAYPVGLDLDGAAMRAYGVRGIPRAFVYDRAGELVWDGHPLDPEFETVVEGVL